VIWPARLYRPDKIEFYRTPQPAPHREQRVSLAGIQPCLTSKVAYIHTGTRAGVAMRCRLGAKGIVIASVGAGAPNGLDKELEKSIKKAAPWWCRAPRPAKAASCVETTGTSPAWWSRTTESARGGAAPDACVDQDVDVEEFSACSMSIDRSA